MMMMLKKELTLLAIALAGVAPLAAQAQDKGATITSSNKLMSKDELRSCMKLRLNIEDQAKSLEQRKAELDAEKAALAPSNEKLKAHRAELDAALAVVKQADNAVKELTKRIDEWNVELEEVNSSKMQSAERKKKKLMAERSELDSQNKALLADRDEKAKAYDAAVSKYNSEAKGIEAALLGWNSKNDKLADDGDKLIDLRADYAADCANRRFKEDDEIAIKKELGR